MEFRIGILGATGYIGTPYREEIRECRDGTKIVALCARRQDRLQVAAELDQAQVVTTDWREVVRNDDVNLVLVLTPDRWHYEPVLECARLKKHVVCEKPIGVDSREAREMWEAIHASGVAHFVPFWTRYAPAMVRAKQIIDDGSVGEIKVVVYRWHNPRPINMPFTWRDDAEISSAGSIADVGSHAYDLVRWLLGIDAKRVLCAANVISPPKPDLGPIDLSEALAWGGSGQASSAERHRSGTAYDYASIAWEFENGAVGTLVLSHAPYFRKGLAPELEVHGTTGSLAVDRVRNVITLLRADNDSPIVESVSNDASTLTPNVVISANGLANRFASYVFPALRSMIATGTTTHPNLHDGYRAQLFTDAAARSAKRGAWEALSYDGLPVRR